MEVSMSWSPILSPGITAVPGRVSPSDIRNRCALHHIFCCSAARTDMHAIYLKVQRIFNHPFSLRVGHWRAQLPFFASHAPALRHRLIAGAPYFDAHNPRGVALVGDVMMGIIQDHRSRNHRRHAEECVAMARAADDQSDKVLWLTLAQSWVRLAEHVARATSVAANDDAQASPETASRSTA
jgi:hypothetical protein